MTSSTEVLLGGTATLFLTWTDEKIYSVKIELVNSLRSGKYYAVCEINPITHSCTSCNNGGSLNNLHSKCSPKRIEWILSPLRLDNAGKYLITLSRLNDNAIQKNSYIYVHEKPSDISLNCYYKMCSSNKLSCECLANPGNTKGFFRWTLNAPFTPNNIRRGRNLTHLSSTSQKYDGIFSTISYDVNKVDHKSRLSCEAINKYDSIGAEYLIEYKVKPVILSKFENPLVLYESGSTTISCKASGHPQPTIKWKLPDGRELSKSDLQMSDLLKHQPGIYSCIAQNCMGNDTRQTKIIVLYSPECTSLNDTIININENQYGTSLKMMCKVSSNPESKIQWTSETSKSALRGLIIENQEGNYKFSSLIINCLSVSDLGTYKCQAKNLLGSCDSTIELRKEDEGKLDRILRKELNDLRTEFRIIKMERERYYKPATIVLSVLSGCLTIALIVVTVFLVKMKVFIKRRRYY